MTSTKVMNIDMVSRCHWPIVLATKKMAIVNTNMDIDVHNEHDDFLALFDTDDESDFEGFDLEYQDQQINRQAIDGSDWDSESEPDSSPDSSDVEDDETADLELSTKWKRVTDEVRDRTVQYHHSSPYDFQGPRLLPPKDSSPAAYFY